DPWGPRGTGDPPPADNDAEARRRRPHVRREIRMRVIDSGVDNADDVRSRTGGEIPCGGRIDVGARRSWIATDDLTGVVEPPQFGESRIVGLAHPVHDVVGLRVTRFGSVAQEREQRAHTVDARSGAPEPAVADERV